MGKAQVVKNVKNKPQGSKFNGKPKVAEAGAAKHKHSHQAHVKTQNKYKSDKKPNTQFKGKFKKDTGGGFQQQRGKKPFNKSKDGGEVSSQINFILFTIIYASPYIKQVKTNKFLERKALRAQKQKEKEEQYEKAKLEKEEQIKKYKKKRLEKTKALSKKTQRGQPLMKDRMQLLLKQIQEMKKNS